MSNLIARLIYVSLLIMVILLWGSEATVHLTAWLLYVSVLIGVNYSYWFGLRNLRVKRNWVSGLTAVLVSIHCGTLILWVWKSFDYTVDPIVAIGGTANGYLTGPKMDWFAVGLGISLVGSLCALLYSQTTRLDALKLWKRRIAAGLLVASAAFLGIVVHYMVSSASPVWMAINAWEDYTREYDPQDKVVPKVFGRPHGGSSRVGSSARGRW